MTQLGDEVLYSHILKNSPTAFRTLYDRHSGPLFRFIYRFTGNRESTEEILHDIFTELLSGKFRSGEDSNLKSWFYTLAKNKSLNFCKKASYEINSEGSISAAPSMDLDLESRVIQTEFTDRFAFAEKSLSADLQQTWNLRKQGLDYQQIANALSIPVGTVKSRFHRLVDYLKKELNP